MSLEAGAETIEDTYSFVLFLHAIEYLGIYYPGHDLQDSKPAEYIELDTILELIKNITGARSELYLPYRDDNPIYDLVRTLIMKTENLKYKAGQEEQAKDEICWIRLADSLISF